MEETDVRHRSAGQQSAALTAEGARRWRRATLTSATIRPMAPRTVRCRALPRVQRRAADRPGGLHNFLQIFQSRDAVVIYTEMIHDARIVWTDGRPHAPSTLRRWLGDSRGRWEGNTLVVDTTNFTDKNPFRGSGENLHLTERFTRTDANTLLYEFTVDDATTFTRPWTAQLPMSKSDERIFEYACHEGNYSLANILRGARFQEKQSKEHE
jgi:hypothetical protein